MACAYKRVSRAMNSGAKVLRSSLKVDEHPLGVSG